MSMIGKVRRMHLREGKSVREIARLTSLSRNTVRAWLREPEVRERRYRRPVASTQLTPFAEGLRQALAVDALRPRRDRRTARALFEELKARGYAGCYSRVTDFIRAWRRDEGQAAARTAFVPLAFEWGEAYQFDWSEEGVVVGGVYYRAQVAHLVEPDFCNVASGWEKGVVEKNVQDVRRRIFQQAAGERFASFTELNAWLAQKVRVAESLVELQKKLLHLVELDAPENRS